MGGRPLLALSIAEFPEELPQETVAAILDAADKQVREAGAILAGGHTIRDREPKYGLAVVGTVHPDGVWPKSGARPGRRAVPDEAARHGARAARGGRGLAGDEDVDAAVGWMTTLNRDWADVLRAFRPNAVTDVTGFGLLGHAYEMAERSGVRLVLESDRWPALDGALEVARAGERTGGDRAEPRVRRGARDRADGVAEERGCAGLGSADGRRPARLAARRTAACARRPSRRRAASSCGVSAGSRTAPASTSTDADYTRARARRDHAPLAAARARALGDDLPAGRGPVGLRALADRLDGRDRPADELGARLRALARMPAGPAVPGEGLPLVHRVREPDGRRP